MLDIFLIIRQIWVQQQEFIKKIIVCYKFIHRDKGLKTYISDIEMFVKRYMTKHCINIGRKPSLLF